MSANGSATRSSAAISPASSRRASTSPSVYVGGRAEPAQDCSSLRGLPGHDLRDAVVREISVPVSTPMLDAAASHRAPRSRRARSSDGRWLHRRSGGVTRVDPRAVVAAVAHRALARAHALAQRRERARRAIGGCAAIASATFSACSRRVGVRGVERAPPRPRARRSPTPRKCSITDSLTCARVLARRHDVALAGDDVADREHASGSRRAGRRPSR